MTLKLRILRSLTRLFIILVSLMRSLFSEKIFPIDALVVWSPSWSKILGRSLLVMSVVEIILGVQNPYAPKFVALFCHHTVFFRWSSRKFVHLYHIIYDALQFSDVKWFPKENFYFKRFYEILDISYLFIVY